MGKKSFGGTSLHALLLALRRSLESETSVRTPVPADGSPLWRPVESQLFLCTSFLQVGFFFMFLPFGTYFKAISYQHDFFVECTVIFSSFLLCSEEADISQLDLKLDLDNDILYKNLFSCGSFVCSHLGKQVLFSAEVMQKYCDEKCNLETKSSHRRHYPLEIHFGYHFS